MRNNFLILKLVLFVFVLQSLGNRSQAVENKKDCPSDIKQIQKMVEHFENEEACKRMSLNECGILAGATAAGATVTAAVLAKRALFLGDSKMPSVSFSCGSSSAKNIWKELLSPKAFAMQACTFKPIQNKEEALKKYLGLSEKALKEKMEKMSQAIQAEVDKGLSLTNEEASENSVKPALTKNEVISSKAKADLAKTFNDTSKADRAMHLLDGYAKSGLSNDYIKDMSKADRDLLTKAHQAYNGAKATISLDPVPEPKANIGLSAEAREELKKIILQGKDRKDMALYSLNKWSAKYRVSSKVTTQLSQSIAEVASISRQSPYLNLYKSRIDQVSMALGRGSKVTKELLEKMPLIDSLQSPKMLELRNFIAAKSGVGILGILDPLSAFAESKLMASNVFLRVAGKGIVRVGGIVPNMVFAAGNENFTLDQAKSCLADKSSELGQYYEQLVDFDQNCQGTVGYDSEKFQNFLALPTMNKVELLSKNSMIRRAYCSFMQSPEPSESFNIECSSANSFSYKSKNGPPVARMFSVAGSDAGVKITADFDDNYTRIKRCPKSYKYESDTDRFTAADNAQISKECSLNTKILEADRYDLVQMSECCQGSSSSFCAVNKVKRSSSTSNSAAETKKAPSGVR